MEFLRSVEGDSAAMQANKLLYLVERMKAMHGVKAGEMQRVPSSPLPSPPESKLEPYHHLLYASSGVKREREDADQPLDFSAPSKKFSLSPSIPLLMFPHHHQPNNKHDSLGSDGHSDLSSTHSAHSPGAESSDSPRELLPGSTSPPRPSLPRLSIPIPSPTKDKTTYSMSDLLTTVNTQPSISSNAANSQFPLLRPIASLQFPESLHQGLPKPNLPNPNLSLPFQPVNPFLENSLHRFNVQNPLNLPLHPTPSPEPVNQLAKISMSSHQKYAEFRENMMHNINSSKTTKKPRNPEKMKQELNDSYGSTPSTPNHNNSLSHLTPDFHSTPTSENMKEGKDDAYWERRRKNNEAAKRSRDSRRMKENEIAVRASFLEQENIDLKMELVRLRTELSTIRDQIR